MGRTFSLAESDDEFLVSATRRYVHTVTIPAAPEHVWAALTAADALVSFSPFVTGMRWLTSSPRGVGSVRIVTLVGTVALTERFYRWDEQRRMTFTVSAASIPGLRRFAEDVLLEPVGSATRLTWTFALEGQSPVRPLLWLGSPLSQRVTASIANGVTRRALDVAAGTSR